MTDAADAPPLTDTPEIHAAHIALTDAFIPWLRADTPINELTTKLAMGTRRLVAACLAHDRKSDARARRPALASEEFNRIMQEIPTAACVHGHPHVSSEPCAACAASDESDPLNVLEFCAGAIRDAIGCEDGLDGGAGTAVLAMIRNAQARSVPATAAPIGWILTYMDKPVLDSFPTEKDALAEKARRDDAHGDGNYRGVRALYFHPVDTHYPTPEGPQ